MQIKKLHIFSSNFKETKAFYKDTIGLELKDSSENEATFVCGESELTIKQDSHNYYYHFAFNIPPNLFEEAKIWTKERVTLLTEDGHDEVDFTGDKAKAIYFEDPAGNIVEFIARLETTSQALEINFNAKHISGISEIGLVSNDVKQDVEELISLGIPVRHDEEIHYSTYLNFFGEYEDGVYIILAPVARKWLFSEKVARTCPIFIETERGEIERK